MSISGPGKIVNINYTNEGWAKQAKRNSLWGGRLLVVLACLVSAEHSWATCASVGSDSVRFPSPVAIQRNAPIGTVLSSVERIFSFSCDETGNTSGANRWTSVFSKVDYGGTQFGDVRKTSVAGIGLRWKSHNSFDNIERIYTSRPLDEGTIHPPLALSGVTRLTQTFELIKIGDIKSSSAGFEAIDFRYAPWNTINYRSLLIVSVQAINFKVVACSVLQSSVSVSMGSIQVNMFSGVGSVGNERSFNISLDCDASTRVNITLNGTPYSPAVQGVLALDTSASETVAGGVGLQLLYNASPVALGTSFFIGTASTSGAFTIPLTARYYQTAAPVTGGQANSTATFELTYN